MEERTGTIESREAELMVFVTVQVLNELYVPAPQPDPGSNVP